ncbi:MAG: pyridoxamine kinase [Hespellia sp.]|nr:pyridoxamine kinase [Hespellia sp.]
MNKKIAVIQDLSGFGRCSLTAAIPVISALGVQACPLPTAILSAQTGYDSYVCDDYTDRMPGIVNMWKKMDVRFDGIYSGFVMNERQMEYISEFVDDFGRRECAEASEESAKDFQGEKRAVVIMDPVMGDDGNAFSFYNEHFGIGMRALVDKADVITPNYTELCLLTGEKYEELHDGFSLDDLQRKITRIGRSLCNRPGKQIVVTGIVYTEERTGEKQIANMIVTEKESMMTSQVYQNGSYSGTGDLLTSVIAGGIVRGDSMKDVLRLAEQFVGAAIADAVRENIPRNNGVNFEKFLGMLIP